jgi:hypothetical protein
MKRAKIALTAIAVFAIVAGAVASKALGFQSATVFDSYATTINGMQTIKCHLGNGVLTNVGTPTITYTTVKHNDDCPLPVATFTAPPDL